MIENLEEFNKKRRREILKNGKKNIDAQPVAILSPFIMTNVIDLDIKKLK